MKAAKQLTGQWPNAKPPDEKMWLASLAATFAGYPAGIVQECVDPRTGLARTREFPPTIAAVVEFCDERLKHHQAFARYEERKELPAEQFSEEHCAEMRRKIAELPRLLKLMTARPPAEAAE